VCTGPVDNKNVLHRSVVTYQTILSYPGFFERLRQSMMRHVVWCTGFNRLHLSTYYKCSTISAVTHKLSVTEHMLVWTRFLFSVCRICAPICPHLSVASCTRICRSANIILGIVHFLKCTRCMRLYRSCFFSLIHVNVHHYFNLVPTVGVEPRKVSVMRTIDIKIQVHIFNVETLHVWTVPLPGFLFLDLKLFTRL
jgi:hypothetical protein